MFDKERTGGIAVSEMRLILSNLPEKLSDEEIDEMLRTADKGGVTMGFEFLSCQMNHVTHLTRKVKETNAVFP